MHCFCNESTKLNRTLEMKHTITWSRSSCRYTFAFSIAPGISLTVMCHRSSYVNLHKQWMVHNMRASDGTWNVCQTHLNNNILAPDSDWSQVQKLTPMLLPESITINDHRNAPVPLNTASLAATPSNIHSFFFLFLPKEESIFSSQ